MKVPGLAGDYCPTCAGVLAGVRSDPKKVIVMCGSVCASVLQESGDYATLNEPAAAEAPAEVPTPAPAEEPKEEPEESSPEAEASDPGQEEQEQAERAGLVKKEHKPVTHSTEKHKTKKR